MAREWEQVTTLTWKTAPRSESGWTTIHVNHVNHVTHVVS
jgi:hypothetical protein